VLVRARWLAFLCAAGGGWMLDVSTPSINFWPATFVGVTLILLSTWGRRPHDALGFGLIAGAAFWMPHISWLTLYLGLIPWAALSTVMILWMGLLGAALGAVTRWFPDAREYRLLARVRWLRPLLLSLSLAGLWVGKELLQSTWPYGGFAWGRLATSLASSPFASLTSWIGFAGLSGLVVFLVALGMQLGASIIRRSNAGLTARDALPLSAVLVASIALSLIPTYQLPVVGSTKIGAVQGNSDAGIFADRLPGDIFEDHLDASESLVHQNLDFFVWPEGALDVDPLRYPRAAAQLDEITSAVDAPLVTGVITHRGNLYFNSSVVWENGRGVTAQYDKRRPVPFAEYMPNRSFYRSLVPDLVDLVQLDYTAGISSSTIDVADVTAGVAICFDIIFDELAVDMIDQGAQIVLAQTNNADFGHTDESAQQLAIARLRAIEMGRAIVVISTVGTSAIIAPDGHDIAALEPFTADSMVAQVSLYDGVTPAIAIGWVYAALLLGSGGVGLFWAISVRALRSRTRKRELS
jgi:apolipoprotein N-acyltransferase